MKKASVPHVTCIISGRVALQEHASALLCRAGSILQGLCGIQAFRHLYALAAEPRCLEAVDADTRQPVSVPVRITLDPTAVGQVIISSSAPAYFPVFSGMSVHGYAALHRGPQQQLLGVSHVSQTVHTRGTPKELNLGTRADDLMLVVA